jgi:hypothetical protein
MNTKVVISGSFRKHLSEIGKASSKFKDAGVKVLAPLTQDTINSNADFVILETDDPQKTADVLEKDFMSKIAKSSFLYIANIEGYIGKSTGAEMCFAILNNIPIVVAEKINKFSSDIPVFIENILKDSAFICLPIHKIEASSITELKFSKFVSNDLSIEQKEELGLFIDGLLEELKGVKFNT